MPVRTVYDVLSVHPNGLALLKDDLLPALLLRGGPSQDHLVVHAIQLRKIPHVLHPLLDQPVAYAIGQPMLFGIVLCMLFGMLLYNQLCIHLRMFLHKNLHIV